MLYYAIQSGINFNLFFVLAKVLYLFIFNSEMLKKKNKTKLVLNFWWCGNSYKFIALESNVIYLNLHFVIVGFGVGFRMIEMFRLMGVAGNFNKSNIYFSITNCWRNADVLIISTVNGGLNVMSIFSISQLHRQWRFNLLHLLSPKL